MSQSIFSTLAYHSIFDYPLTLDELHRFLLVNRPVSSNEVKQEVIKLLCHREPRLSRGVAISPGLPRRPDPGSGLLAMTGNEKFFDLRVKRHRASLPKFRLAARAARLIGLLPTVKLVCVTGSLAMENSDETDDIDLMIVTSPNRLWLTRPLVVLLISLFFKRRKPTPSSLFLLPSSFSNTLCLNLWLDCCALAMPPHRRDLRTAHELAQMKPVVNRDGTYEKMMWENRWGSKYLANIWNEDDWTNGQVDKQTNRQADKYFAYLFRLFILFIYLSNYLFIFLNKLFFFLQYLYMRSKMTNERVSLHAAFFHPGNRADTILKTYDRLCHRSF